MLYVLFFIIIELDIRTTVLQYKIVFEKRGHITPPSSKRAGPVQKGQGAQHIIGQGKPCPIADKDAFVA